MAAINLGAVAPATTPAGPATPAAQSAAQPAAPATKKRATFHELRVAEVRRLTDTSVEVTFEVPPELAEHYVYLAGQYLALRATIDGEDVRRSYSICRPPADGRISVAIKRDEGGLFSSWVNDSLKTGDTLQVMTPQGAFTSNLAELDGRHVVGIAAGSGITPIITMAHRVLLQSDTSRFDLLFTNRSSLDVMFVEELADEWVLCGPFELVQLCRDLLSEHGVESSHVRFELFTTGEPGEAPTRARPIEMRAGEKAVRIDFTLDGTSATVESPVSANESLLNAALRVRSDVPFACAGGVCGTCRARVVTGSVTMTENYALEPEEMDRGYVLTCQSHPQSDRVVVDYDA